MVGWEWLVDQWGIGRDWVNQGLVDQGEMGEGPVLFLMSLTFYSATLRTGEASFVWIQTVTT